MRVAHTQRDKVTYPTRGNETDFLTGDGRAGNRRRLTNVLVVTTTVRMVNGVHSNTTSTRPAKQEISILQATYTKSYALVTLGLVFVERTTSLE